MCNYLRKNQNIIRTNSTFRCFLFSLIRILSLLLQIEDATDGVGGWGETKQGQTRIKERRIVLCLDDKGTTYQPYTPGKNGTSSSSGSGAGAGGEQSVGKLKFRRLNNGAGEFYACVLIVLFYLLCVSLCLLCVCFVFASLINLYLSVVQMPAW